MARERAGMQGGTDDCSKNMPETRIQGAISMMSRAKTPAVKAVTSRIRRTLCAKVTVMATVNGNAPPKPVHPSHIGPFYCREQNPKNGRPCMRKFKRKWNLERHIEKRHHAKKSTTFIQMLPPDPAAGPGSGWERQVSVMAMIPTQPASATPTLDPGPQHQQTDHPSAQAEPESRTAFIESESDSEGPEMDTMSSADLGIPTPSGEWEGVLDAADDFSVPDVFESETSPSLPHPRNETTQRGETYDPAPGERPSRDATHIAPFPSATPHLHLDRRSREYAEDEPAGWQIRQNRKRKLLEESEPKDALPEYSVKRSKLVPGQQEGIEWMLAETRRDFLENRFSAYMSRHGVKDSFRGACIHVVDGWASLEVDRIAEDLSYGSVPLPDAKSPIVKYGDHTTNLTRAVAWFTSKRWDGGGVARGVDLDNFIGSAYKPMQGSHLCHHELCIIHLTYETVEMNNDRKRCHAYAKHRRRDGASIPLECNAHNPPCLLQHASLTRYESMLIQFSIFRMARNQPAIPCPRKPAFWRFPTFEHQLPLSFCGDLSAVKVYSTDLTTPTSSVRPGKPELCCPFCKVLNGFASISAVWSHLLYRHYDPEEKQRDITRRASEREILAEVRRTARIWNEYWTECQNRGKSHAKTRIRLQQALSKDFTFDQLLAWKLS